MNKDSAYEYLANKKLLTCLSESQMQSLIRVIKDPNNENNYQIDVIKYACEDFIPKEVKKKMIREILLYLWQLPQNLLGLLVIFFSKAKKDNSYNVYITNCRIGVSLGKYIILNKHHSYNIILHEQGHQKQSLYFGWLYLIIIGIPSSIFVNLWDRIFHKKWTYQERIKWYYSRYPERWADKLGGVIRS